MLRSNDLQPEKGALPGAQAPEQPEPVRKVNAGVAPKPDRRHRFTPVEIARSAATRRAKRDRKAELRDQLRADLVKVLGHAPSALETALIEPILTIILASLSQAERRLSLADANESLTTVTRALRALRMASKGAFERTITEAERRAEFRKQVFGEEKCRDTTGMTRTGA